MDNGYYWCRYKPNSEWEICKLEEIHARMGYKYIFLTYIGTDACDSFETKGILDGVMELKGPLTLPE